MKAAEKFMYDGKQLDIVFDFQYLGLKFNYNNKFKVAQKHLYDKAARAMFTLLRKAKYLMLPVEIQIELFDRMKLRFYCMAQKFGARKCVI